MKNICSESTKNKEANVAMEQGQIKYTCIHTCTNVNGHAHYIHSDIHIMTHVYVHTHAEKQTCCKKHKHTQNTYACTTHTNTHSTHIYNYTCTHRHTHTHTIYVRITIKPDKIRLHASKVAKTQSKCCQEMNQKLPGHKFV